jgi:uncharacterized protein YeaO (DUF488 family)
VLEVFTARISYAGADRLDVTARTRDPIGQLLAPSWEMVAPLVALRKRGLLTAAHWDAYRKSFLERMRASYARARPAWREILARETVTLLCFCVDKDQCHRRILAADVFAKLGAIDRGER